VKFLAIVRTTVDAPDRPILDDAWAADVAEANPLGIRQSLADVLVDSTTHRAAVVVVEVPDGALLAQLGRAEPIVPGSVTPGGRT
jgi:hypothetical protein